MLLVQGRGEMAALSAVSAVLLHHCALVTLIDCEAFRQGRIKIVFLSVFIVLLIYHIAMNTWTYCNFVYKI